MTESDIPPEFIAVIREHLPKLPPEAPIPPDFDLAAGGLESLAMVSLLLHVEEQFEVKFPDDKLTWDTFKNPRTLWAEIVTLSSQ